jgi:hypothetical protein
MSMNFSEFNLLLGADPRSREPEFQRARHSSPEFEAAASEADRFEARLDLATLIPAPDDLLDDILTVSQQPQGAAGSRRWLPMALAASLLLTAGAAGWMWNFNRGWSSVEEYVVDHYRHDGDLVSGEIGIDQVQSLFAGLDMQATPALASIIGVIKYCPTPDGKGIHMILNTGNGPVTVIYMPGTHVVDREMLAFDHVEAMLVELESGSAAIIGPDKQSVSGLYSFVQESIIPSPGNS